MADGHLNFDTRIDTGGFNKGIKALKGLGKVGVASLGALAAGFGAVTKASLDSVASLEQNVGGVETLFKKSADTVIKNAERAYMTAGLSANDYMSTVTSFSASLLKSLGGDTAKAASYADRAIIDMSDNANKMGTSMELIQNAYQGFAKQNYTMLDNLKLGYGGTKTEMQRLIADASKMKDVQKELGVTVDESSMSFGNIVNAISVMQKSMDIAGTTSKEAMTTIEGSVNATKAAWDNFMNGTSDADELASTVVTAATNIINALGDIVPRLASTIPAVVKQIYGHFADEFEANKGLIGEKAVSVLNGFIEKIQNNAPTIITAGANLLSSLGTGISQALPTLIPKAFSLITTLANAIIQNIPTIFNVGISILTGLVQGIINSLPTLITEGPRIINDFADAIYSGVGKLISTAGKLIVEFAKGLIANLPLVIANAGQILLAIINAFSLSKLFSLGKSLIQSATNGIKAMGGAAKNAGSGILKNVVSGIKSLATHPLQTLKSIATKAINAVKGLNWRSIGTNIISGIVSGVKAAAGSLTRAAANAVQDALSWVKRKLGIHSPSRVFRDEVGKMMALGMGVGFENNVPTKAMTSGLQNAIAKVQKDAVLTTSVSGGSSVGKVKNNPTFTTSGGTSEEPHIEVNVYAEMDGTPLVAKVTKATIKKINGTQKNTNKAKGK